MTFKETQNIVAEKGFILFKKSRRRKVFLVMWTSAGQNYHALLNGEIPKEKLAEKVLSLQPTPTI